MVSKSLLVYTKLPATEQATIDSLQENFERVVKSLFEKSTSTVTLNRVLEHVFKFIGVKEEETRKRAIKLFYACLENFADACAPGEDEEEVPTR